MGPSKTKLVRIEHVFQPMLKIFIATDISTLWFGGNMEKISILIAWQLVGGSHSGAFGDSWLLGLPSQGKGF